MFPKSLFPGNVYISELNFLFSIFFILWDAGGTCCDAPNPPYPWVNGRLLDTTDAWIRLYPDVQDILAKLTKKK